MKLFLIFLTFSAFAQEVEFNSKFTKPTFDLELSMFSVKEDALSQAGSANYIDGHVDYLIDEKLTVKLWPSVSFISGEQTSRDPQNPLTNAIYLKEGSIEYKYNQKLALKAGALYQKDFLPGLAGEKKSFPAIGFLQSDLLGIHNHDLKFDAQIAVPTSSGLANTTTELESQASLLSAVIKIDSEWNNQFKSKLAISYFKFNNLSSQAALDSLQRGNTVIKPNSTSALFYYKYAGTEFNYKLYYSFSDKMDFQLTGNFITNNEAPVHLNFGYLYSFEFGYKINSKLKIKPIYEHFSTQADAMVAVFSDVNFGRTNRKCDRFAVNFELPKFDVLVIAAQSKLIQKNPFQSDDKSLFLALKIKDISI
jgi:hypothetical protein